MGKSKSLGLSASSKSIDPTLDALFATSSGPVQAPPKSRYSALDEPKVPKKKVEEDEDDEDESVDDNDEELSEASQELDYEDDEEDEDEDDNEEEDESSKSESNEDEEGEPEEDVEMAAAPEPAQPKRERKRKRKDEHDDLEDKYLSKLADSDHEEEPAVPAEKRQKSDAAVKNAEGEDAEEVPVHESLADKDDKATELEKADRTVYIANAPAEAVSSKKAKRTLLAHLSSVLDASEGEKIESIRFRSIALSAGAMPKRAAYITGQLMEATTKSTNAYAVYSSPAAARKATSQLNGSEVLGRHIRLDSVSHPAPTDHRRCVFVGNLGFVDDESVLKDTEEGEVKTKRNKVPADVEEGLWRTFAKSGKVENVRVVRDPKTRVGKGFAYVQFYDTNSVESALLLDGQKFPPMLPRKLRVTRAKDPRRTALAQERDKAKFRAANAAAKSTKYQYKATPEERSQAGRAAKLLGRSGAAAERQKAKGHSMPNGRSSRPRKNDDGNEGPDIRGPEHFVFEGTRATANNGRPKDLKLGRKGKGGGGKKGKPENRSTRRAAEWRKKT